MSATRSALSWELWRTVSKKKKPRRVRTRRARSTAWGLGLGMKNPAAASHRVVDQTGVFGWGNPVLSSEQQEETEANLDGFWLEVCQDVKRGGDQRTKVRLHVGGVRHDSPLLTLHTAEIVPDESSASRTCSASWACPHRQQKSVPAEGNLNTKK